DLQILNCQTLIYGIIKFNRVHNSARNLTGKFIIPVKYYCDLLKTTFFCKIENYIFLFKNLSIAGILYLKRPKNLNSFGTLKGGILFFLYNNVFGTSFFKIGINPVYSFFQV